MYKKILLLSLCLTLPLLGESYSIPHDENMQIGRYQMVVVGVDHPKFYLLDTATGLVWKSTSKNSLFWHDAWELQIESSPENP